MLKIDNLTINFNDDGKKLTVVDNLSYRVKEGEITAVVGESGCGKTVHALSLMQLLPPSATASGKALFDGQNILELKGEALRALRGGKIGIVFQDPMTSLNPVFKIASQITETLRAHKKITKQEALKEAVKLVKQVGLEEDVLSKYPHQLSGGMRQRVMIAVALCCGPKLLIADEPTTALDVCVQAQILQLIKDLRAASKLTVIFITHNLAIVDDLADRVVVLYGGVKVEEASKKQLFDNPLHPYTQGLLGSVVSLNNTEQRLPAIAGNPPVTGQVFKGCNFASRCKYVMPCCTKEKPPLFEVDGRCARCWLMKDKAVQNG